MRRSPFKILLLAFSLLAIAGARGEAAGPEVVRVGVWEDAPFVVKNPDGSWGGLTFELWREVARELGLRYEVRAYPHHRLFEALAKGEVDVGLSDIPITHKYGDAIRYSRAYIHANLAVAGRSHEASALERIWEALTSPGVLSVVGVLLLLIVAGGVFFWFVETHEETLLYRREHRKLNFFNGIMWAILLITAQEPDIFKNDSFLGRVIAMILLFIGVTVSAGYIALITSSLTVSQMKSNIHDVRDLPFLKVASISDSRASDFLAEHHINHREHGTLHQAVEALESARADALVADDLELHFHVRHHLDYELSILPVGLEVEYYAIAFPGDSALVETVDPVISMVIRSARWREIRRHYVGDMDRLAKLPDALLEDG